MIAAKGEQAGLTMSGSFASHREMSQIYEFRLKHQIKRNKPITPGLPEYVEELRKIDGDEEIMLCAFTVDDIAVNIFAVGAPSWLIGFASTPSIDLPRDLG